MTTKHHPLNFWSHPLACATVISSLGLVACSTTTNQPPPESAAPPTTSRPVTSSIAEEDPACSENFRVALKTQNGVIVSHQIVGNNEARGRVRYSGKYFHVGEKVYFTFRADACPNNYWLADVDPKVDSLTAYSNREPSKSRLQPVPPPCSIGYKLEIEEGRDTNRIRNHTVMNAKPEWGVFQLVSVDKTTQLATFDNWQYPGCHWLGVFPNRAGLWRADFPIVPQSCEQVTVQCAK